MVVAKLTPRHNFASNRSKRVPKPGRIANRAKRRNSLTTQMLKSLRAAVTIQKPARHMCDLAPRSLRRELRYAAPNCVSLISSNRIGPTQTNRVGTVQACKWFTQCAARKDMFKTKRLERVEQHDVQISR